MMTVLIILCALMIAFAGGCALMAIESGAWTVMGIPAAIVVANVLVILDDRGCLAAPKAVWAGSG